MHSFIYGQRTCSHCRNDSHAPAFASARLTLINAKLFFSGCLTRMKTVAKYHFCSKASWPSGSAQVQDRLIKGPGHCRPFSSGASFLLFIGTLPVMLKE